MAEFKVVDVSAWQENINFKAVMNEGVKAAIIRITERYNKTDSYFERNYTGFKNAGAKIGVYKFSYAMSVSEIQEEARIVVSVLKGRELEYPVFLDLEYANQRNLGKNILTKMVQAFRQIIVDAGYKFGIYCNVDWYNNVLDTASLPYDYWLAAYPYNDNGSIVERLRPSNGIAWQFTSKYKISGQNFDMSLFYKDYSSTSTNGGIENMVKPQQIIDDAVDYAIRIANDNEHGYSQAVRSLYNITNPKSYDCSSLVLTSYYYAFMKNGLTEQAEYLKRNCSYTGNMTKLTNCGFEIVARNQTAHSQMQKGDIELNVTYHTALAIDGDNIVHARTSEGTSDTKDNSGNEIRTQSWYRYSKGWDMRLRLTGKGINLVSNTTLSTSTELKLGDTGSEVKTLQESLIKLGYSCGSYGADGEFGSGTKSAVKKYQKDHNLTVNGVADKNTLESIKNQLSGSTNTSNTPQKLTFTIEEIKKGSVGNHVLLVQEILRARGFTGKNNKPLELDKEAGEDTIEAIRKYQVSRNGACGRTDGVADVKTLQDMIAL